MEIEIKIPLTSEETNSVRKNLVRKWGKTESVLNQEDIYWTIPMRNIAETDEAVRTRKIIQNEKTSIIELTYKGPKTGEEMKIREEINVRVDDEKNLQRILERIDCQPVESVSKKREVWKIEDMEIALDDVVGVGKYMEVEINVEITENSQIEKPKNKIKDFIKTILPEWDGKEERKSYLELKFLKG